MRALSLALVALSVLRPAHAQDAPVAWQSRLYSGGSDTAGQVVSTPTGLQVKTVDAGLWWNPTMVEKKAFAVILEGEMLPESVNNGFGVFVGGRDLDNNKASYLSFQIKGDGTYLLELREGSRVHALAPWMPHRAIPKANSGLSTHYVVRFEIRPLRIDMVVNNVKVHTIDRATVRADGIVGMRFDAGMIMALTKFGVEPIN